MRIAIDAMGGDHAPKEIILGVKQAMEAFSDVTFILVGDKAKIQEVIQPSDRIEILHTDEVIHGDEEPIKAIRSKKNSSLVLANQCVADGKADACISAGNTGALMAAGLFVVGRMEGIERPALAPTIANATGGAFLLLDVGANVDAKPEHLLQHATMGSIYMEKVRGIKRPTVGLVNVGTEDNKGNELAKQSYALLKNSNLNFIGNVETRDILNGAADVVVTDGFTGNIVLKTLEGTALTIFSLLKESLTQSLKNKLAALVLKKDLRQIRSKLDYSEYGGAGLFGLKAPVIKAHGSSKAYAIYHAIRQAREMVIQDVMGEISKSLHEGKQS